MPTVSEMSDINGARRERQWLARLGIVAFTMLVGCASGGHGIADGTPSGDAFPDAREDAASDVGTDAASDARLDAPPDAPDSNPPTTQRVLFIGNSYTGVNGLPEVVAALGSAPQSPVRFQVEAHTPGGATWEVHDQNPAVDALIAQGWDVVVLQDQSEQPWANGTVKDAVTSLDNKAKAAGAKTVLFMTWARSAAVATPLQLDTMNKAVSDYYERNAAEVGAAVAPVGRAWERALRDPTVLLHDSDGSHPNARGTYLTSCVLYAELSGSSPVGLGNGGLSLPPEEASGLQKVAEETIAARQLPTPPLLGQWPLSMGALGSDIIPSSGLALGGATGPGGEANAATQFRDKQLAIAPYFAGINPATVTVTLRANRADWSVPTTGAEFLAARPGSFGLWVMNTNLHAQIHVPGSFPSVLSYDARELTSGWHVIALTYDGAQYALWVDGSQVASGTSSGSLGGGFEPLAIGGQYSLFGAALGSGHFNGALADIRLYSVALSASELNAL